MHIPDGFLDARTAVTSGVMAVAGLGVALARVRRGATPRSIPLIGLAAAFVFAAQMLNFPVGGGTSGHLVGAVLIAVLLGPSAAVLAMSAVVILQCFMFNDGGVTALGANLFNMALVAPLAGHGMYRAVRALMGPGLRARLMATAFAAWVSIVAAAVTCAAQLAVSGTVRWSLSFPAMTFIHMLIGLGEALITTLVVAGVIRLRPELFNAEYGGGRPENARDLVVYGLLISMGMALFLAPAACGWPDGLERVATALGFEHRAMREPLLTAPMAEYSIPGLRSAPASTAAAGAIGTVIAFLFAWLLARVLTSSPNGRNRNGGKPDDPR